MDLHLYDLECQRVFQDGLKLVRNRGHGVFEVEHVALALLSVSSLEYGSEQVALLKNGLEKYLATLPRVFGATRVEFGARLDHALDDAESPDKGDIITLRILWEALRRESTVLKGLLGKMDAGVIDVGVEASDFENGQDSEQASRGYASGPAEEHSIDIPNEISRFIADLTLTAEQSEVDPVIGREREVQRLLEILGRKTKNNPVLVGEPGVGKSAIVEALAIRIARGHVPMRMKSWRLLALDLGSAVAGAKYRGEFEQRITELLAFIDNHKDRVILFIDEVHTIVGAGAAGGSQDLANLLKPALARSHVRCIGATTLAEYRRFIEPDGALERRFQPLYVEEPTAEEAVRILSGLKARYEVHHGIKIDDAAIRAAVELSIRYIPYRFLPDKAIDILDEAASRLRMQLESVPQILDDLRNEIDQLEIEKQASGQGAGGLSEQLRLRLDEARKEYEEVEAAWVQHQKTRESLRNLEHRRQQLDAECANHKEAAAFEQAAQIQYGELPEISCRISNKIQELAILEDQFQFLRQTLSTQNIADVVSFWTGIPLGKVVEDEHERLKGLEQRLGVRVFGQEDAIAKLARALRRAFVGINDPRRPYGVFLFLGPTGVGKTQTAKCLAEEVFGTAGRLLRIDMTEYGEAHTVARLIGAPPGYIGYGDAGELTEPVKRRPYSVVLFDEIEKAHPKILDLMLQLFDDGRLTDARGITVDFSHTIIIMTSNLGVETMERLIDDDQVRSWLAATHLRPELVNRIDDISIFKPLRREHLGMMLEQLAKELNFRLSKRQFRIVVSEGLADWILTRCAAREFGGRALERLFRGLVIDQVSARIVSQPELCHGLWMMDLDPSGGIRWSRFGSVSHLLPPAGF